MRAETALRGNNPRSGTSQLLAIGLVGGTLSGLLGVGGGIIMVPLLVFWAGFSQRVAHATSLTAILPISIGGILTYGSAGEINFLWAACLATGAVLGAPVGARILSISNDKPLKIGFGTFLVFAAIAMVLR
jgi:uncharacterized membrane protein YfcA